jgi:lipoprotein-anchoring transpeptidase ErfK/SrfK
LNIVRQSLGRAGGHSTGRLRAAVVAVAMLGASALAGCDSDPGNDGGLLSGDDPTPTTSPAKTVSDARLQVNVPRRGAVHVDRLVTVSARNGTLQKVTVTAGRAKLAGDLSGDGATWTAGDRLEPGTTYHVTGVAVDSDGLTRKLHRTFRTTDLTLDQQTYPSIAPLEGETVGVGMPVIVTFDVPVTDRAEVERHLSVETSPQQKGTWHWISDNEVHYRPRTYWKAGTDVTVDADLNGVNAGNGIYGQEDRVSHFHVGDALIMKIDIARHHMRVLRNGTLLRTLPVTGGKAGFTTRSGIKVIIEKFRTKRMDSATTGINPGNPEYYNLSNVEYAQRVTYSGEFLHAAPWSVGSQGYDNVSHGCVGMNTANAAWLYSLTKRGDVVDVTGTDRPMEPTNGYGDWNLSWADYKAGSALR